MRGSSMSGLPGVSELGASGTGGTLDKEEPDPCPHRNVAAA
jgi:hypothetical protein